MAICVPCPVTGLAIKLTLAVAIWTCFKVLVVPTTVWTKIIIYVLDLSSSFTFMTLIPYTLSKPRVALNRTCSTTSGAIYPSTFFLLYPHHIQGNLFCHHQNSCHILFCRFLYNRYKRTSPFRRKSDTGLSCPRSLTLLFRRARHGIYPPRFQLSYHSFRILF